MRVLVCGGRDYSDRERVFRVLDRLHAARGITTIVHGGAPGADSLAEEWADERGVPVLRFDADWRAGPSAGPMRNQRMLDKGRPDLVVAFPGHKGTADMVRRTRRAQVAVMKVEW